MVQAHGFLCYIIWKRQLIFACKYNCLYCLWLKKYINGFPGPVTMLEDLRTRELSDVSSNSFSQKILFFFPCIYLSWRLITLQYCSGFCYTLIWISHGFTCVPHPEIPSHLPQQIPNWSIIGLQCCFGFCYIVTTMWLNHKYIYLPSLMNLPPMPHPSNSFF